MNKYLKEKISKKHKHINVVMKEGPRGTVYIFMKSPLPL